MKNSISQNIRTGLQGIPKKKVLHMLKILFIICFAAGFVIFFFLGKEFVDNTVLLDSSALKEIRDTEINKGAFLQYVFIQRIAFAAIGAFLWWWGFGRPYLYGIAGSCGIVMGGCFYICIMRYPFKGLLLWFFLYFPHMIFYAGALFFGIILSATAFRSRAEKLEYLWQNAFLVFLCVLLYVLGIYNESYINVTLLQFFLQYF